MCQILEPVANAFEKNAGHNNLHKHKQIVSHWAIKSFCTVCRCRKAEGALQNVLEVYRVKWITSHACIVDITVRKWLLYCLISNPQKLSIIWLEKSFTFNIWWGKWCQEIWKFKSFTYSIDVYFRVTLLLSFYFASKLSLWLV